MTMVAKTLVGCNLESQAHLYIGSADRECSLTGSLVLWQEGDGISGSVCLPSQFTDVTGCQELVGTQPRASSSPLDGAC